MKSILLAGVLLVALVPLVASADVGECTISTQEARVTAGDFYVWMPGSNLIPEIWKENNGVPGLQRGASPCEGAPPIPRDACINHTAITSITGCILTYPVP